jgi:dihydrofolate reductase
MLAAGQRRSPRQTKGEPHDWTDTWDVFATLDGFGFYGEHGDWGGYWGKQGPQLLSHRLGLYGIEHRMVFGAKTFREQAAMLGPNTPGAAQPDRWVERMMSMPTIVVSSTLKGPFDWPDATVARGDAVEVVARLKEGSDVPLRSHGSLSINRAVMAAGLVDEVQLTIFPVISGRTGVDLVFEGAADFDLELLECRTLDGHTQGFTYRPSLHVRA